MNNLTLAAVQFDIEWENYEANLRKVESIIKHYSSTVDLIIFPEMFLTGFSMNNNLALPHNHKILTKLMQLAQEQSLSIAGSLMIKENDAYYNRFYYFSKDGKVYSYNKRHLFRMANEHHFYKAGNKKLLISEQNFSIQPFICYDLRFPVWMRNVKNCYDLAIVVANWPESRIDAWNTLLKARAIENQCYVVGINRIGVDGKGIQYSGGTAIFDFKGTLLAKATDHSEEIVQVSLQKEELVHFRESFPAYQDADEFELI